jgi:hypothetical protein
MMKGATKWTERIRLLYDLAVLQHDKVKNKTELFIAMACGYWKCKTRHT